MPPNAQQLLQQQQDYQDRVSIFLDLPIDDMGTKELPFQLGIIGDFTGNDRTTLDHSLADRDFLELDNQSLPRKRAEVRGKPSRAEETANSGGQSGDNEPKRQTLFEAMLPNLALDDVAFLVKDELAQLLQDFGVETAVPTFDEDATLPVRLKFDCMESFSPRGVIEQIVPLEKLFQLREMLVRIKDVLIENPELEPLIRNWAVSQGQAKL